MGQWRKKAFEKSKSSPDGGSFVTSDLMRDVKEWLNEFESVCPAILTLLHLNPEYPCDHPGTSR